MNLKVIHLIRKVERIDRDMEEIQTLLDTLQMDREYSQKVKDSLIEEFHRLKKFRKEILKQVVHIPPGFENFIEEVLLSKDSSNYIKAKEIKKEISIQINKKNVSESNEQQWDEKKPMVKTRENFPENENKEMVEKKNRSGKMTKSKKTSPFLFRFE